MRDLDPDFYAALLAAPERGIVPRKLVTFTGWTWPDGSGNVEAERMSFWTGDDDTLITVTSGLNNLPSTRTFYGGVNLEISAIPRVSSLTVQTVTIQMTAFAPVVQELVRGLDIRLAKVEIWDALLDPDSRLLAGAPTLAWLGVIDGSPINTESDGGDEDGGDEVVEIKSVNDAMVMLTRPNPAKSSHEEQKKRLGPGGAVDDFGKYAGSVGSWRVPWGEK